MVRQRKLKVVAGACGWEPMAIVGARPGVPRKVCRLPGHRSTSQATQPRSALIQGKGGSPASAQPHSATGGVALVAVSIRKPLVENSIRL